MITILCQILLLLSSLYKVCLNFTQAAVLLGVERKYVHPRVVASIKMARNKTIWNFPTIGVSNFENY